MPVVESSVVVPVSPDVAFAVSQTTGDIRMRWDVFIREQRLLDGATVPAVGVRTLTVSRRGLRMVSEYVSYRPPTSVGMKVTRLPWFFEKLAGGWRFAPDPESGGTLATWKYNFSCRPRLIAPIAEWIGVRLIRYDIDRRIAGFARGCSDPVVLAAARAALE
jgi:hypothetical protein